MIERSPQQRRFPRVDIRVPVRYQMRGYPKVDYTLSQDLSIQGLRITGQEYIPPETQVSVDISLKPRVIHLMGKIAWTVVMGRSDRNQVGIEFIEVDPNERVYLASYIRRCIEKRQREERGVA